MPEWLVRGSVIRQRRRELGLTQQRLAALAGVGRRSLQRMEGEPGVRFHFDAVRRVAAALGCPLSLTPGDGVRGEILRYPAEG